MHLYSIQRVIHCGRIDLLGHGVSLVVLFSVSIPNDIVCKGLDWVETTFPVVHAPAEQVNLHEDHRRLNCMVLSEDGMRAHDCNFLCFLTQGSCHCHGEDA